MIINVIYFIIIDDRATQPAIVINKLNLDTLPEKLSCGCSCFECRTNYQGNID